MRVFEKRLMNQILKLGQTIPLLVSGALCKVEEFLGDGGQGEVYRVGVGGKALALKVYYPEYLKQDKRQRERLEMAIKLGPPSDRFLWPMELAGGSDPSVFGYVMALREARLKSFVDLMKRRIEPSFRTLATAGFELAHSFLLLHAAGLCYRDISLGNVFLDPTAGAIAICDNDNVDINGQPGGVDGTPRFMAPEIVTGAGSPNAQTDLYSLSVLLFYLAFISHPLEGARESSIRCFDLPAQRQILGTNPIFIFDPKDDTNRPVKGYHDNALVFWPIYPAFIRALFTRAFTAGLKNPDARVRESEWRAALIDLRDSICYCVCGKENFYDGDGLRASGGKPGHCWSCKKELRLPFRIRIGKHAVMLNHDSKLFPHHSDAQKTCDFSSPVAEVVRHPTNLQLWGLKNLSGDKWVLTAADGSLRDVEPGRNATLAPGIKINFGRGAEGEIRA
jgi:DNA-binding helix-hairpin-helix protein with protein kinase domain